MEKSKEKSKEKPKKMSIEEKHELKLEKWLKTLTADSEFFGLLGVSKPDSFYKIYARRDQWTQKWWLFQANSRVSHIDPTKYHTKRSRENHKDQVSGKLVEVLKYKIHPGKKGLEMLFARAKQLA